LEFSKEVGVELAATAIQKAIGLARLSLLEGE
jgi:hypothetical protein